MPQLFIAIFLSAVISFFLTPLTRKFFESHGWIENPREKQLKTNNATALKPIPRGGGLPIFISVLVTSLLFLPGDKHLLAILFSAFLTLVIGLIDDLKDLSPKTRLFTNLVSALIVVASGIGIAYVSNPLGGVLDLSHPRFYFDLFGPRSIWILSDFIAVFWIVWCMNIVGWSAGVEGQLPGFVSISAFFIGILGIKYAADITQWPVIILAGAVSGAYLGFLPFNFYPQSIMPGYSGKSLAGLFLSVLAILSGAKLATVIFLLGIPMLDATFVLTVRIFRYHSLFKPNNIHLHHYLLNRGWSRRKIALIYWTFSLVLGVIALTLNSQQKFYTFIGIAIISFSFFIRRYQHN
ncbi:MAG: MraY family glycosyltransferase [Candidatus Shapirobacteria bacterium]|jgi:UDP-GlcNAc:undecaprenyl-phosphate GlcNAc-1-phosphate transferase